MYTKNPVNQESQELLRAYSRWNMEFEVNQDECLSGHERQ